MAGSGLLLFAHGARDPLWARPFEQMADLIRHHRPALPVVLGYLEFMSPSFTEAAHELHARGCTRIDVLPLFLGAGGHVRRDLPRLLAELHAAHPEVLWQLHPAIGEMDSVIAAMAHAALNTLPPDSES